MNPSSDTLSNAGSNPAPSGNQPIQPGTVWQGSAVEQSTGGHPDVKGRSNPAIREATRKTFSALQEEFNEELGLWSVLHQSDLVPAEIPEKRILGELRSRLHSVTSIPESLPLDEKVDLFLFPLQDSPDHLLIAYAKVDAERVRNIEELRIC